MGTGSLQRGSVRWRCGKDLQAPAERLPVALPRNPAAVGMVGERWEGPAVAGPCPFHSGRVGSGGGRGTSFCLFAGERLGLGGGGGEIGTVFFSVNARRILLFSPSTSACGVAHCTVRKAINFRR